MLKPSPASALNVWDHKVLGDLLLYFQAEEPGYVLGSWNKICDNPVGLCLLFWGKTIPGSALPRGRRGLCAVVDPFCSQAGTGQLDVVGLRLAPEGNFVLLGGWKIPWHVCTGRDINLLASWLVSKFSGSILLNFFCIWIDAAVTGALFHPEWSRLWNSTLNVYTLTPSPQIPGKTAF